MDTANEPAGVEPRLPPELECIIFEMVALTSPTSIPELMRVAQRVKEWVEPILYRVVFLSSPTSLITKQLILCHIEGFPLIPRDLLLQLIRVKPPSFFASAVKHFFLDDSPTTLPLKLSDVDTILAACSRLSNLFVSWRRVSLQLVPTLNRLESLRRLTIDLESLFEFSAIDFTQPFLRNITYLELLDSYELSGHPTGLALLPHLTHIAFNDMMPSVAAMHAGVRTNTRLQCIVFFSEDRVEPEAEDDRFVGIEQTDFQVDCIRGATGGRDHWALADNFIAAKRLPVRACSVAAHCGRALLGSLYWISDEDNFEWTTSRIL
ncbi:hypothetical protein DFH06DRAFT_1013182 [Mycena polygramma]|nr:hypothetical protein DFH06DRAFT_1013182 [Mycena polygramma]